MFIPPHAFGDVLVKYIDEELLPIFPNWTLEKAMAIGGSIVAKKRITKFFGDSDKIKYLNHLDILNEQGDMIDLNKLKAFATDTMSQNGGRLELGPELGLNLTLDQEDIDKVYSRACTRAQQ